jgi:DNA-binding CsgD family transcriptional regulator
MKSLEPEAELLDLVYDAAVEPARWSEVLERLADLFGSWPATLMFQNQTTGKGHVVGQFVRAKSYFSYYATRNPLLKITDYPLGLRVVTDEHKLPKQDLMRTEFYNDFMRPLSVHSALMLRLAMEDQQTAVINLSRPANRECFDAAEIERANKLHPHLVRSFRFVQKIFEADQLHAGFVEFLENWSSAVFVVSAEAKIRYANRAGEALLVAKRGLNVSRGTLQALERNESRKLHLLIGNAAHPDREHRAGSGMAVTHSGGGKPLSITVMPARNKHIDLFRPEPLVLVSVADPFGTPAVSEQRLQDLMGFSRAESRIAKQLLDGHGARAAAENLGLSYHTVRAHLVRMCAKTGTSRQVELVQMMTRAVEGCVV